MKCLIDMDGVIVDLVPAWLRYRGFKMPQPWPDGEYDLTKIFDIRAEHVWAGCDEDWWENLPPTQEAGELMALVADHFDHSDVYIVTKPVTEAGATGKLAWLRKHYPAFLDRYIMTPCRHLLANRDTILIDDQSTNVDLFNQHGGYGVIVPRLWNHEFEKSNQPLDHVRATLRRCVF